ncbi:bifunctional 23S rRNA (guanine(2069)-N(7))-methyltransferase RlmK/23S rRNA (guanine(2445)-N(2))-methyltransferase RlmL [Marinobacter panjinensis]|uniref:Ribosomal RNA large subunit methyltransferase K/L n=1 Tax=Marinobacter panjinensis TaxID=2576384 RepID=A0A4U6QZE4_9GAMM|nr:bifunctional 23S rRNA (guanine(2069)-N(7))-methyltransferase RlmK/23S rRNA (guanine(2445)-N(2))-methyltransferase RlmL [Marinobacter panjinensis]MCR8915453.1 bifunctional 23S rRNA (guanine(2069)-N(7))-methyltransferase RlmK/23S rRNA (guanine(2445)-N(2))-methyltransferase RlmL [Marinobacter panjinensis]TKV66707.1 bifunctional 23S rRNA (guanine(2069)-N(7))-methyltransferase RlmK/23S rRNA (guanine(2445)-N(2))-methyltransferase RlmL [Marinobacter panjinensis]
MSDLNFFVTCPKGLEYLLEDELRTFGMDPVRNAPAGVWANGTLESGYRACLWSRLANRVILHLADVDATSGDQMLGGVTDLEWQQHIPVNGSFRVNFVGQNEEIRNTQFGAQRVKDGIVDRLRSASGQRPSVDAKNPDVTVSARLNRGTLSVGIELSGDSLHKRGYRTEKGAAPLKENLAAALLTRCGWPEIARAGGDFIDPMCGSGTLVIEAAMMALDLAPGRKRECFGFERWLGHQPDLWLGLRQEAEKRAYEGKQGIDGRVPLFLGFDQDRGVIQTARNNLQRAGLESIVTVEQRAIDEFARNESWAETGLVLVNPPYGERLSERKELGNLYRSLGEAVKAALPGWRLGVFTGAPEYGKSVGLRSYKQYRLYNGKLPAQLLLFTVDDMSSMTPREPDVPGEVTPRIANEERAAMLRNRLKKNLKTVGQWARKQGIGCYRLYDADMPEFALAIDIYEGRVHVQEYAAPKSVDERSARERLAEALAVIPEAIGVEREAMVCKQRQRQAGTSQYEKQAASGEFFNVHEHGCVLKVNLKDYLDTGLFLDHRPVRHWIQQHAAGKRFLNLFCYTGAATVHAAVGGATRSLSLDMSKTYVNWAEENLALNRADASHHRVEQADCLAWLAAKPSGDQRFDLIFMDPPTFSNSARMAGVLDIQKDHGRLIRQAMRRLTSEGLLIFSTNFRRFKLDESLEEEFAIEEVTRDTLDRDFQRNARIHRCFHIRTHI